MNKVKRICKCKNKWTEEKIIKLKIKYNPCNKISWIYNKIIKLYKIKKRKYKRKSLSSKNNIKNN